MTYAEIVEGLRQATLEINHEGVAVRAGHKQQQEMAAIVERYSWLFSPDSVAAVEHHQPRDAREAEARERVRAALLEGMVQRAAAPYSDRLTTYFATASVRLADGEEMPYYAAQARLTSEPDAARREALGDASATVVEAARDLALEVTSRTLRVVADLGFPSYVDFWSSLKRVDYPSVLAEVSRVSEAMRSTYVEAITPWMDGAGHEFGSCPQWHVQYFRGIPEHAALFSQGRFSGVMRQTFEQLGLDLFSTPVIHIDIEDRPTKNPRASVFAPEAGVEVHLLTRPTGGHGDYAAFLHEAGHALHFGLTDPAVGWPLANLSRSMAYPELWSYLVERIGYQPEWIAEATAADSEMATRIARDIVAVDLTMFMRYVSKLEYELRLFEGDPLDVERGRQLYATVLGGRTGFAYDPRLWQADRDPGFYSADYLRAWLAEATLELKLRERFGPRWWASSETGRWLREQWRLGCEPEAEETVTANGGAALSGDALLSLYSERFTPA